jgi:hypothetical protein
MISEIQEFIHSFDTFGYKNPYTDVLALVPGDYKDIIFNQSVNDIKPHQIFPVSKMDFNPNVQLNPTHMIGSFENTNITGGTFDLDITFEVPIFSPTFGWVNSSFATLWYLCGLGVFGTPLSIKTAILSYDDTTHLAIIDNIIEFCDLFDLNPNQKVFILDKDLNLISDAFISGLDKSTRSVIMSASIPYNSCFIIAVNDYPISSSIVSSTLRSPSFLLWSLSNGLIGPCLVNSITIVGNSEQDLIANVNVKASKIDRSYQIDLYNKVVSISKSHQLHEIFTPILGNTLRIDLCPGYDGDYGTYQYIGQGLTEGFQTPDINNTLIYTATLNIKNNLKAEHTDSSLNSYPQSSYDNSFPSFYYSDGRTIDGSIEILNPLDPKEILEKLVGNGYINSLNNSLKSGIRLSYGSFYIVIPGVVWSPGARKSNVGEDATSSVKWYSYNQNSYFYPNLEYLLTK